MSMVEDRVHQLLNAELDGELDAAGQSELDALLATQVEFCREREALRDLADCLRQVKDIPPPAGLAQDVLARIRLPSRRRLSWQFLRWAPHPMALPSAAFAVAIVVVLGVYWSVTDELMSEDPAWMVGSVVRDQSRAAFSPQSRLSVSVDAISGEVTLGGAAADMRILQFQLSSAEPVDIVVDLSGSGLEFGGFAGRQDDDGLIASDPGSLKFRSHGERSIALMLRHRGAGHAEQPQILIEFSQQRQQLYQGVLDVP